MASFEDKKLEMLDYEYSIKISDCREARPALEILFKLLIEARLFNTARELDALETRLWLDEVEEEL